MAEATSRPNVKTPLPQRDDLQKLIPDNVRLRRALEQLFIDVATTLPTAIQDVGDNSQAVTEDVSMGLFGATDRKSARLLSDLSDAIDKASLSKTKRLERQIAELQSQVEVLQPVRPRVEKFIAPTLLNSWVDFGLGRNPAGYYRDSFSRVYLRGMIKSGTVGAAAFTLPAGYRPANHEIFSVVSNDLFGAVNVFSDGNVQPTVGNNTYFSLDGITFRAA